MSEIVDVPILLVHVSSADAVEQIRWAHGRGLRIFAETCPQYLVLTADHLDAPGFEGAKYICSPPPRDAASQQAVWRGLATRRLPGRLLGSRRVPLRRSGGQEAARDERLVHEGAQRPARRGDAPAAPVLRGRQQGPDRPHARSWRSTATNAAKLYGLYPRKGTIAVGSDADLVIWDKDREVVITNDLLHHNCDYTPYEGMSVRGWPAVVFSRGEIVVEEGKLLAEPGRGQFLRCDRPAPTRA